MRLHSIILMRQYTGLHEATQHYIDEAIHRVTRGFIGLNEATLSYMSLERVTRGCTGLPDATLGLKKVM